MLAYAANLKFSIQIGSKKNNAYTEVNNTICYYYVLRVLQSDLEEKNIKYITWLVRKVRIQNEDVMNFADVTKIGANACTRRLMYKPSSKILNCSIRY